MIEAIKTLFASFFNRLVGLFVRFPEPLKEEISNVSSGDTESLRMLLISFAFLLGCFTLLARTLRERNSYNLASAVVLGHQRLGVGTRISPTGMFNAGLVIEPVPLTTPVPSKRGRPPGKKNVATLSAENALPPMVEKRPRGRPRGPSKKKREGPKEAEA